MLYEGNHHSSECVPQVCPLKEGKTDAQFFQITQTLHLLNVVQYRKTAVMELLILDVLILTIISRQEGLQRQ